MATDVRGPQVRSGQTSPAPPPGGTTTDPEAPEVRRNTSSVRATDVLALAGAGAASVCLTLILFGWVAPFSGPLGFIILAYLVFLVLYAVLVSLDESRQAVRDRLVAVVVHSLAGLLLAALVFIVVYTFVRGGPALVHLNFYTQDQTQAGPLDPITVGGMTHALIGTLEQIGVATALTVPLGISVAVFLNEVPGTFARVVRTVSEAMTALPSIVAGLFVYATVVLALGLGECGLAASLALGTVMLPVIIRSADVVIRLVPSSLKEASYALGTGRWRTVWSVVLPTARAGLTTAVILGVARGIGETAEVLLTSGYTASMNTNPVTGWQTSLPLLAFRLISEPYPNKVAVGFGVAAFLLALVLLLFTLARILGGRDFSHQTRRQTARRAAASARDLQRFDQRHGAFPFFAGSASGRAPDDDNLSDHTRPGGSPTEPTLSHGSPDGAEPDTPGRAGGPPQQPAGGHDAAGGPHEPRR